MKIFTDDVTSLYVGDVQATKAYLGSELVFSGGSTPSHDYSLDPLTLNITSGGNMSIKFTRAGNGNYLKYQYDAGGETGFDPYDESLWEEINITSTKVVSVNNGDKIYFLGDIGLGTITTGLTLSASTAHFTAEGNILSLKYLDYDIQYDSVVHRNFFIGCTGITSAENLVLPATALTDSCYSYMFSGCTNLQIAPKLPATSLATQCYVYMFKDCSSLTSAPDLPAPVLAYGSYTRMFERCSSLNHVKCLATDMSATNCLKFWMNGVSGVSSTGTFIKHVNATWNEGISGIPSNWTVETASS